MVPGVFARTYASKVPAQLFARMRADGFSATQFNLSCAGMASLPHALAPGTGQSIARAAADAGIHLCALSGTYNMAHPDASARARERIGFANVMQAAKDMGVSLVTLCTGSRDAANMWHEHPDNASPAAWAAMREELDFALTLADKFDLRLGVEPEPGNVVRDAKVAEQLLKEARSARLGIVLDAANLLPPSLLPRQNDIVAEAADLLGEHLFLVHAKDIDSSGRVVPAGQGAVDLPAFVARMAAAGYRGALVGHGFEEADAPAVAAYLATLSTLCAPKQP